MRRNVCLRREPRVGIKEIRRRKSVKTGEGFSSLAMVVEIFGGGNYAYSLAWIGTAKQSRL